MTDMVRWMEGQGEITSSSRIISREISAQLQTLSRTKLSPLEEDYLFQEFFEEYAIPGTDSSKPAVTVIAESDDYASEFLSSLLSIPVEKTSNISVLSSEDGVSKLQEILSKSLDPDILSHVGMQTIGNNSVVDILTFITFPVFFRRNILIDASATILLVLDEDQADLSDRLKRFVTKLGPGGIQARLRMVIITRSSDIIKLVPIVWCLSKVIEAPEMPKTYFIQKNDSGQFVPTSSSDELFRDLLQLPNKALLSRILHMQREAKLARSHALLMSYLKSQLPTFNRAAKQEKLLAELESVIATVASTHGLPITEFPSAESLRMRLSAFDFNRVKKMKESNLALVNEFLNNDIDRILKVIPHSEEDILLVKLATSGADSSREQVANLTKPPVVSDYVNDFEALGPKNGLLEATPALREHLLGVSKLPSSSLFKIWKLVDVDQDGKLSLREYAMCRELVKSVFQGGEIPRRLPPSFIL